MWRGNSNRGYGKDKTGTEELDGASDFPVLFAQIMIIIFDNITLSFTRLVSEAEA